MFNLYQVNVVDSQEVQAVIDGLQYVTFGEVEHVLLFEGVATNLKDVTYRLLKVYMNTLSMVYMGQALRDHVEILGHCCLSVLRIQS